MSLYSDSLEFVVRHMPPDTHLGDVLACVEEVAALVLRGATPLPPPEVVTHTKVTPATPPTNGALELPENFLDPEEFFSLECDDGTGWTAARALYQAYVDEAEAGGCTPLSGVKFGAACRQKFKHRKTAAGIQYAVTVGVF